MSYFKWYVNPPFSNSITPPWCASGAAGRVAQSRHRQSNQVSSLTFQRAIDHEELIRIFRLHMYWKRTGVGRDRVSFGDLSRTDVPVICRQLHQCLKMGDYRPQEARSVAIPKSSGNGTRALNIRGITDRVISYRMLELLQATWEPRFIENSYAFRPRRSRDQILHGIEQQVTEQQREWMVNVDIKSAFDVVPIANVLTLLWQDVTDKRLRQLLELVIRGTPSRERGIDQGSPLSPLLLNVLLHEHLDKHIHPLENGSYFRFADNLMIMCDNALQAQSYLGLIAYRLNMLKMPLKPSFNSIINLRERSTELLGYQLSVDNYGQLIYSIPDTSWDELNQSMAEIRQKGDVIKRTRDLIQGWLRAYGAAFDADQASQVCERISQLLGTNEIYELIHWAIPVYLQPIWLAGYRGFRAKKTPSTTTDNLSLIPQLSILRNVSTVVRNQTLS